MSRASLNKNNSAVKRIMQEARELANDPSTDYTAAPLEDDIFEWHCTIRGPAGTEFEGGLYHFRILLPTEYPFRPPSIMVLTPNGRFELNTKICISFTSYHEELWQPAWGVRTAIIGLQGFFPLKGTAAVGVGAIEYPTVERKRLAALSRDWVCPRCGHSNLECLPDLPTTGPSAADVPPEIREPATASTPPPAGLTSAPLSPITVESPRPSPASLAASSTIHSPVPLVAPSPVRPVPMSFFASSAPSSPASPAPSSALPSRTRTPTDTDTESRSSGSSETAQEQPVEVPIVVPSYHRPPVVLDTAICVILVLMVALIARKIL